MDDDCFHCYAGLLRRFSRLRWLGDGGGGDVDAFVELRGHSSRQRSPTLSWELILSAGAG